MNKQRIKEAAELWAHELCGADCNNNEYVALIHTRFARELAAAMGESNSSEIPNSSPQPEPDGPFKRGKQASKGAEYYLLDDLGNAIAVIPYSEDATANAACQRWHEQQTAGLRRELADARAELEQAKSDFGVAQAEADTLRAENERLKKQLAETRERVMDSVQQCSLCDVPIDIERDAHRFDEGEWLCEKCQQREKSPAPADNSDLEGKTWCEVHNHCVRLPGWLTMTQGQSISKDVELRNVADVLNDAIRAAIRDDRKRTGRAASDGDEWVVVGYRRDGSDYWCVLDSREAAESCARRWATEHGRTHRIYNARLVAVVKPGPAVIEEVGTASESEADDE